MTKTFNPETGKYEWDKPQARTTTTKPADTTALEAQVAQLSAQVLVLTTAFESLAEAKSLKEIRELAKLVAL
jgi:hypothetical protein